MTPHLFYLALLSTASEYLLSGLVWGTTAYVGYLCVMRRDHGWPVALALTSLIYVAYTEFSQPLLMKEAGVSIQTPVVDFGSVQETWTTDWPSIAADIAFLTVGFLIARWVIRSRLRLDERLGTDSTSHQRSSYSVRLALLLLPCAVTVSSLGRLLWLHAHGGSYMKAGESVLFLALLGGGIAGPLALTVVGIPLRRSALVSLLSVGPLLTLAATVLLSVEILDIEGLVSASWVSTQQWGALRSGLLGCAFFGNLVWVGLFLVGLVRARSRRVLGKAGGGAFAIYFVLVLAAVIELDGL